MNAALWHRGPDGGGIHLDGPAALAARRLAIIDLAGGDQPMLTADGELCVVQNGEILNHLELRAELERQGVRFRTRCDTEVLLHLYPARGRGSSPACAGCSRSRCGTAAPGGCFWPATGSGSSRSTTRWAPAA